jgi:hypothetical protein
VRRGRPAGGGGSCGASVIPVSDGVSLKLSGDPANDTPALPCVRVRRGRSGLRGEGMTHYAWFAEED